MEMTEVLQKLIQKPEGNSFGSVRDTATSLMVAKGLPTKKNEEYKYTNLLKPLEKNFAAFEGNIVEPNHDLVNLVPHLSEQQLVIVNGVLSEKLSTNGLPAGVEIETLQESKHPIGKEVNETTDEYELLNTSNLKFGIALTIEKDVIIESPIVLVHITDSSKNQAVSHPRVLVHAKENTQVTIVELFLGHGGATSFTNAVTEITAAKNSNTSYIKIGNEIENQLHVGNTNVSVAANAVFNAVTTNFGGQIVRNNLHIELDESNSEANLYGLYVTDDKEHIDNHTVVNHKVANCNSNELYKGILNGSSKGVFNGKIFVQKDAQKTNAFQSNKNILLSNNATINTKPQLEIWADDVKCSHGCTTGKLDKEQLFYLKSRGIDENSAKTLLLNAFSMEVLDHINDEKLKQFVIDLLQNKIGE